MRLLIFLFPVIVNSSLEFNRGIFNDGHSTAPKEGAQDPFLTDILTAPEPPAPARARNAYSEREEELAERIILGHKDLSKKDQFSIYCFRSVIEGLPPMHRGSFAERRTRLRCVHGISNRSRIGPEEAKILKEIFSIHPLVEPESAQTYLSIMREGEDAGREDLPTLSEIFTWLEYARKIRTRRAASLISEK